jgi:hypothetical protein
MSKTVIQIMHHNHMFLESKHSATVRAIGSNLEHKCKVLGSGSAIYTLTHSWSWAILEKPPIVQLLKNFPAFYGTQSFITVSTRALHWSLS